MHRVGGEARGGERLLDECGEGGIGVKTLFATAEDGSVAALQAEDSAVDGDVGARFVDDADDADGDADLADTETVGTRGVVEDGADGIGERDDFADGLREVGEAGGVECEAVARGRCECGGFGRGECFLKAPRWIGTSQPAIMRSPGWSFMRSGSRLLVAHQAR